MKRGAPFIAAPNSVKKIMLEVVIGLIPGIIASIYWWGFSVLSPLFFAVLGAIAAEALCLYFRKRLLFKTLNDSSALVTGLLLAFTIPPSSPWWLSFTGGATAILIGKQLFGGLGQNPFNPAMVAYLILLIALPQYMTNWPAPYMLSFDAVTGATPLDQIKISWTLSQTLEEAMLTNPIIFKNGWANGWAIINFGFLIGGLFLLWRKTIRWHIPVGVITGIFVCSFFTYLIDPSHYAGPFFHLFAGGSMLAAFFIATDPVSAATSDKGRFIYGLGIGIIAISIRSFGLYPDGIAFAIILMNILAPTIDRYTIPKAYGHVSPNE